MNKLALKTIAIIMILLINCTSASAEETDKLVKPIKVFNLTNGQTVIIKEVHTNPIVTIDTWVKTGSINEDKNNNGVSHFLEHLLFKGTTNHQTGEINKVLESKGAEFNAGTSKDYTHFYVTISSDYLNLALKLHADMLLNASIPPEELTKERKVVLEEILRSEDSPQRQVYYGLNDLMFKIHPYEYDTLGTEEVIKNISREEIFKYYHKWYIPSNMVTIIVGDVNTEEVLKLVKANFDSNPAKQMTVPVYKKEPPIEKTKEKIVKGDYKQTYLEMGFRAPSMQEIEKSYALDVAAMILGQGRTSRLYKRLKQDCNLVNSLFVSNMTMKDDGIFVFDYDMQPENLEKVKNITLEEIAKIKNELITQEELERSKKIVARNFIYSNESVSDIATSIGYSTITGKIENYLNYVDNINAITPEDVKKSVNEYLNTDKMAISILIPENEVKAQKQNKETEKDLKNNNECLPKEIKNPEINKYVLPNGLTLLLKSNDANDVVTVSAFIKGGKLVQNKAGIANLITNLLTKGTESRSAEDIASETENMGVSLEAEMSEDYLKVSYKSTKNDFTEAFMVFMDVLKNSTFEQKEIGKAKESIINAIKANKDSPITYSIEKTFMSIYENHPYGDVGEKVINDLPQITREDLIKYYKKYFIPENMVITVVGNIPPDLVKRYVEQCWEVKSQSLSNNKNKNVKPLKKIKVTKVPKDSEAAWISMAWLADSLNEKDYPALKIINALLGSGLSSRLAINLREEKGMAYDVGSFFPSRKEKSVFVLYIGTNPKNINTVIKAFKDELNKLQADVISEEDLNDTKQKITGQYDLLHETNAQQAFYLGWFESMGLGFNFDNKYPELINNVSQQELKEAAIKIFSKPYVLTIVAPQEALDSYKE